MAVPPTPVIRDIDVYDCDEFYCYFNIYFDPPPEDMDVELEVYLDGTRIVHGSITHSGELWKVGARETKYKRVSVQIVFRAGIMRSWSREVIVEASPIEGMDVILEPVASSNLAAVGWRSALGVGDSKLSLDAATVGTLLRQGEMPEDEAHTRFRKMGYSDADADYLIVLNSPD